MRRSFLHNGAAESFFPTLKTERLYRIVLITNAPARRQLIQWFDRYDMCTVVIGRWPAPIAYERNNKAARAAYPRSPARSNGSPMTQTAHRPAPSRTRIE
jgi:hypothetical protein